MVAGRWTSIGERRGGGSILGVRAMTGASMLASRTQLGAAERFRGALRTKERSVSVGRTAGRAGR